MHSADSRPDRLLAFPAVILAVVFACASAWAEPPRITIPSGTPVQGKDSPPLVTLKAGDQIVALVWSSYDSDRLYLRYRVFDRSPLQNSGDDYTMLFKTGDSVDLQIALDPQADPARDKPAPGDLRLLMTRMKEKAIVVAYRYRVPGTESPVAFGSPMGHVEVDRVERIADAEPKVEILRDGYVFSVSLSWKTLARRDFTPKAGMELRGDFGVLFSDPNGGVTVERIYWSNQSTSIVADVPSEIRLTPSAWGRMLLGK